MDFELVLPSHGRPTTSEEGIAAAAEVEVVPELPVEESAVDVVQSDAEPLTELIARSGREVVGVRERYLTLAAR